MTDRQQTFLQQIIEQYIEEGEPVGSHTFINKYKLTISSATVRNEMAELENLGFLEKAHTSSGRIPSLKGYEYYAKHLANKEDKTLQSKLEDIFARRRISIDTTLDEAAKAITEMAGITLVTSNSDSDELMKSIQLTPINTNLATIVIVTSSGRVESKLIEFNSYVNIEDVRIAVRLFKERLIDTKLRDLAVKVEALAPILEKSIKNYEAVIQAFVGKVFDFHNKVINKVYGNTNIIKSDIKREDLAKLIDMMQNQSIWSTIEGNLDEDKTMKIEVRDDNTSIISKRINFENKSTEISVVGSNRMDYAEAKQAILLLEKFLSVKKERE